jgi:hypothetical protein
MSLDNIEALLKIVPVNLLNISLFGSFWEKIEKFLVYRKFTQEEYIDQISKDIVKTFYIKSDNKKFPVICNTNAYICAICKKIKTLIIFSYKNFNIISSHKMGFKIVIFSNRSSYSCIRITRLFFGRVLVGEYMDEISGWNLIFPYSFVIDVRSLPRIPKYSRNPTFRGLYKK